jgi:hypothetical protein
MQKPPKKNNPYKKAVALSGIGLEMGITIFLVAKGGKWLDDHYGNEKRIFTAMATLLGVAIAIYRVLASLKRLQK